MSTWKAKHLQRTTEAIQKMAKEKTDIDNETNKQVNNELISSAEISDKFSIPKPNFQKKCFVYIDLVSLFSISFTGKLIFFKKRTVFMSV